MTHIAIQENLEGKTVDWLEKVSNTQYGDDAQLAAPDEQDRGSAKFL